MHPNSQMTIIGYVLGGLIFFLMIPLLPFFLVYYVVDKLVGFGQSQEAAGEPTAAPGH